MRRKIVLAMVLCLATAALGIGAAPALAADGCICHTADPPTASAAHTPFVASVTDCTTCHVDWVVPHPEGARAPIVYLRGRSSDAGYKLSGGVGAAGGMLFIVHADVLVYLQQRLWGATEFTDLTQVTTGAKGGFTFTVASPPPFATYRAIAQGHVVTTALFKPRATTLLPTPELSLAVRGFDATNMFVPARVKLGRTLRVSGAVAPTDLGGKVTIRVLKRVAGKWATRLTAKRAISATGTYSWRFTPKSRGAYRMDARIPATAAHRGVVTRFSKLRMPIFYVH